MKPLKPSMQEDKRYLLVEGKNLEKNIEKSILDFVGVLGRSKAGLKLIKTGREYAIVSLNRQAVNEIRASFSLWPEKIIVKKVSGTLKGLKKKNN